MSGDDAAGTIAGVKSPCISVCEMDAASGYCRGCWRTLDEIGGWIAFSEDEKRAVLDALRARRAAAQGSVAR